MLDRADIWSCGINEWLVGPDLKKTLTEKPLHDAVTRNSDQIITCVTQNIRVYFLVLFCASKNNASMITVACNFAYPAHRIHVGRLVE